MADELNQVLFSFLTLQVSASGAVSFLIALGVVVLLFALAWRLVKGLKANPMSAFGKRNPITPMLEVIHALVIRSHQTADK